MNDQQAFVLRIAPSGHDMVRESLDSDQILIGWTEARGLLDENLDREAFREIVRQAYYVDQPDLRVAGAAAGHLWRFIREMGVGDLVVVPFGSSFYVAKVDGPAVYDKKHCATDSAYRRPVSWQNNKQPIPRKFAKSALTSRMKTQGTCARATDVLGDIQNCLRLAKAGKSPTFYLGLQERLTREALDEMIQGYMESFGFENLVKTVMQALGASKAWVVPRNKDKGADIIAEFLVGGFIQQTVAIQVKHWKPDPPIGPDVVDQLVKGMEVEEADLGMIVTTGSISDAAHERASDLHEEQGLNIVLVDGEQFAKLIVEFGIGHYASEEEKN